MRARLIFRTITGLASVLAASSRHSVPFNGSYSPMPSSLFRHATFLTSVKELHTLPPECVGEVAFAGRSNAGKSSALNSLADHNRLAFVSKTPGRTQLINYFTLGEGRALVDLPGYGYAKVPMAVRAPWGKTLGEYLIIRQSLKGLVVVMDIRHPMTDLDLQLLAWFQPTLKPVHVLLTKSDKLTRSEASATLLRVRKQLAELSPIYSAQLFSSLKKTGTEEAETVLAGWLDMEITRTAAPPSAGKKPKPKPHPKPWHLKQ
jgi:GTP-binding protein